MRVKVTQLWSFKPSQESMIKLPNLHKHPDLGMFGMFLMFVTLCPYLGQNRKKVINQSLIYQTPVCFSIFFIYFHFFFYIL